MDNNSKIVLLNVENNSIKVKKEYAPPFGLLIAASVLLKHGMTVSLAHIIEDEEVESKLLSLCQDACMVGFSTMTTSNLVSTMKASRLLKKAGHYIFWGGVHATLLPETSLKEDFVDAVLRGEAEANLVEFIQWRRGLISSNDVKGLCYKDEDGNVFISNIPLPVPAHKLSCHAFHLIDIRRYLQIEDYSFRNEQKVIRNVLPYMTSKGCSKKCTFCYNTMINHATWRGYPLNQVIEEMDWLKNTYDVEGWYFYDDNFFGDVERAWSILRYFKMPSFVEVDLGKITDSFIENAKQCCIERLYIGIESGSDRILKKIKKGITVEMIKDRVSLCNKRGISMELSFMVLFPTETPDELQATFELIEELRQYNHVKIDGPKIFNPYPGAELYNELIMSGWKPPSTNEEWAKYERDISPLETGFELSDKHYKILEIWKQNFQN